MFRRAVQKVLDEESSGSEASLKMKLSEAKSVSVTLDIWSDKTMRGSLGLTVHFIDGYALKSSVLAVPRFAGKASIKTRIKY